MNRPGLNDAVVVCSAIYNALPRGIWVALTGGTLYKEGVRKDLDLVLYSDHATWRNPLEARHAAYNSMLLNLGPLKFVRDHGYVTKFEWGGTLEIDFLFPEFPRELESYYEEQYGSDYLVPVYQWSALLKEARLEDTQ